MGQASMTRFQAGLGTPIPEAPLRPYKVELRCNGFPGWSLGTRTRRHAPQLFSSARRCRSLMSRLSAPCRYSTMLQSYRHDNA